MGGKYYYQIHEIKKLLQANIIKSTDEYLQDLIAQHKKNYSILVVKPMNNSFSKSRQTQNFAEKGILRVSTSLYLFVGNKRKREVIDEQNKRKAEVRAPFSSPDKKLIIKRLSAFSFLLTCDTDALSVTQNTLKSSFVIQS